MRPQLFAVIDDREPPPAELERLIGDVHFGDLLRRRRRYLDELLAAAAGADETMVLRTDQDADHVVARMEAARGDTLWLRLPVVAAPLDMEQLGFLIRKMRYALRPMLLGPVFEDEAPTVLFPADAAALLSMRSARDKRSFMLQLAGEAARTSHQLEFVDLRQAGSLRRFLAGATETRAFNSLSADGDVFVKSSTDIAKMRAEHDFFELAPPAMRRFLLPTFGYEEGPDDASYRMENLRVPDAALQFVLGAFSEAHFDQLLDQFFAYAATRAREPLDAPAVLERGREQILRKMNDRLERFADAEVGRRVDAYLAAGAIDEGLAGLRRRAAPLIDRALADHGADHLAFSHGDPCLSNILFDRRIGLMRLIDPRGATRREEGLMHPLYDIAKFSHSICGGYDFVNNGLFSIEVDADLALEARLHRGGAPDWMKRRFRDRLEAEGWRYRHVRAVEASLFLSMLPLHLDHQGKLLGFALIARDIIEELEGIDD
ncbi:MAG: hypothetical protein AAF192_00155 [Pseudomonadota bacterium]